MEDATRRFVLELARKAVEAFVKTGKVVDCKDYPEELKVEKGVFVTLYKGRDKELRGCIGVPYPKGLLIDNLIEAATSACRDPRFEPLKEEELKDIILEISILSTPQLIKTKKPQEYLKKIEPNKDGLILKRGMNAGLFLPTVWKQIPEKEDFLSNLCMKAGLLPDSWLMDGIELYKFGAEVISEE